MNFSGKQGHPNIQPSTRPGIELGTLGLGDRDPNNPSRYEDSIVPPEIKTEDYLSSLKAGIPPASSSSLGEVGGLHLALTGAAG